MGMEPINSILSLQAQTMTKPVTTPKVTNETAEGTAENVTVPKLDNNTVAVAKTQKENGKMAMKVRKITGSRQATKELKKQLKTSIRI